MIHSIRSGSIFCPKHQVCRRSNVRSKFPQENGQLAGLRPLLLQPVAQRLASSRTMRHNCHPRQMERYDERQPALQFSEVSPGSYVLLSRIFQLRIKLMFPLQENVLPDLSGDLFGKISLFFLRCSLLLQIVIACLHGCCRYTLYSFCSSGFVRTG